MSEPTATNGVEVSDAPATEPEFAAPINGESDEPEHSPSASGEGRDDG